MADITLVNLNMLYVRYMDAVDKELHLPLGPLYLTTAMEKAGLLVDFRDYQLCDAENMFDMNTIAGFCADPAPVIGLSCMANLLPFTIMAAKELKNRYPDRTIVLGGVGPKAVEKKILERFPWIDIIHHGEGEVSGVQLVQALKNKSGLHDVPGIFYRKDSSIACNPQPPRIQDIDSIGLPAYHHVPVDDYDAYGMISSRGCPYPCTFCSVAPIWGRNPTYRSAKDIVDEMKLLHEEWGVELYLFQDEFFVASKKRVVEFCETLGRTGLNLKWKAFGRVNLTDAETMKAMAETGCMEIRYGIESGSARILEKTKKGFTPDESVAVVGEATTIFPRVDAFFVWGFPFETMEDFHQSLFQMVSFRLMGARILPSLLCFLPQTDVYNELEPGEKLQFSQEMMPEYMITGHEINHVGRFSTAGEHEGIFEFIRRHPDIFPGFFLVNIEENIKPKLKILQEHGFYTKQEIDLGAKSQTESCGAHSPHL